MNKQNKTQATDSDVLAYINTLTPERRQQDALYLLNLFTEITDLPPVIWGGSMIGFGQYHYQYDSGREGDFFMTGFAMRKQNMVIYLMAGFEHLQNTLQHLGKHKTGKSCLYINKLADIDEKTLKTAICLSFEQMKEKYSST